MNNTVNTLVMKLKEGKNLDNVYKNEEYIFFPSKLVSVNDTSMEIEVDIAYNENVAYKIISIDKNMAYVKDLNSNEGWYKFIEEEGKSVLYLTELKNSRQNFINEEGNFDIWLNNKDIIENFDVVEITI